MNIGKAIREARREHGWTQAELEERTGVLKTTISALERNTSNTRLQTLFALADGLGVKASELIRRAEQYDD